MIKIENLKRTYSCSTCDKDAVKKIVFTDPFTKSASSVHLCDSCLNELKNEIHFDKVRGK